MNRYSRGWIGVLLSFVVIYFGVVKGASNPKLFLNLHALILVVGGTFAVSLIAFPIEKLYEILEFVVLGFLIKKKKSNLDIAKDFIIHAKLFYSKTYRLKFECKHPFMTECFNLLKKKYHTEDQYYEILSTKIESVTRKYFEDSKILISISKFPPALGLLGASTGMIEMMQNMGSSGGVANIGSAMSVALVATLWGIGIANFIILPLSDYAIREAEEDQYTRNLILDSCFYIKRNYSLRTVIENLLAKLSIQERTELIEFIQSEFRDNKNLLNHVVQGFNESSFVTESKKISNDF